MTHSTEAFSKGDNVFTTQKTKSILPAVLLTTIFLLHFPLRADPTRDLLGQITAENYPDSPAVTVYDSTRTEIEPSGLSHVTRHVLVKLLTEKGASDHASMRFDYDPASNTIEVKDLVIHRRDGQTERRRDEAIREIPQPQRMIYWGARMKLAALSWLAPGDGIEYRV